MPLPGSWLSLNVESKSLKRIKGLRSKQKAFNRQRNAFLMWTEEANNEDLLEALRHRTSRRKSPPASSSLAPTTIPVERDGDQSSEAGSWKRVAQTVSSVKSIISVSGKIPQHTEETAFLCMASRGYCRPYVQFGLQLQSMDFFYL